MQLNGYRGELYAGAPHSPFTFIPTLLDLAPPAPPSDSSQRLRFTHDHWHNYAGDNDAVSSAIVAVDTL